MSIILRTEELRKDYPTGGEPVAALRGVNMTIEEGRFYAIVGRSGSGKSTLLHLLGGFDRPTSGRVLLEGEDISQLSPAAQARMATPPYMTGSQTTWMISKRRIL